MFVQSSDFRLNYKWAFKLNKKKNKISMLFCKIKTIVQTIVLRINKTIKLLLKTTTQLILC